MYSASSRNTVTSEKWSKYNVAPRKVKKCQKVAQNCPRQILVPDYVYTNALSNKVVPFHTDCTNAKIFFFPHNRGNLGRAMGVRSHGSMASQIFLLRHFVTFPPIHPCQDSIFLNVRILHNLPSSQSSCTSVEVVTNTLVA